MKKLIWILIFLVSITGCVNSRIIYHHPLKNENEFTEIVVYRRHMFLGSALLTHLSINGISTAELKGNEYVSIKIDSGEHLIITTNPVNVSIAERRVFNANQVYFFDATYVRRKETDILPEIDANTAGDYIETMVKVN